MIIDSNVVFGFELQYKKDLSIEKILKTMDGKSIDKALITNIQCKYFDFMEGNNETAEIVKRYPDRFIGMSGFNLAQFIDIEREVERGIYKLGLAGIRFFNTDSNFTSGWGSSFHSLTMRRVLKQISGSGIFVFIEGGYPFRDIRGLAEEFPEVPIIASGLGYGNAGEAILAVEGVNNLFLEISTLDMMDGVKILVEYVGAERIIFGTGMLYNSPSPEIFMVKNAEISEEDQKKIFSANIMKILDGRRVNQ